MLGKEIPPFFFFLAILSRLSLKHRQNLGRDVEEGKVCNVWKVITPSVLANCTILDLTSLFTLYAKWSGTEGVRYFGMG